MAIRVAINGFGRIGRNVLRAIAESGRKDIEVVGINDLGPVETNAHLLRFDSVHGRFPGTVTVDGDSISVGNGKIKVSAERDPSKLPWKELGVDIALECTGIFSAKAKASAHLTAGAKRVLVSAPSDGADTRTRLAPAVRCEVALALALKMPVHSSAMSMPRSFQGRVLGSRTAVTLILPRPMSMLSPSTFTSPGKRPCTLSKRSRCALLSTEPRSLMATTSMSVRLDS